MVARTLADRGLRQRLIVRDPGRAPKLDGAGAVQAGYGDADAARIALAGVEVLFMVSGAEAPDRLQQHKTFIRAAAEAGVKHIVYTSFLAAAHDATFTLARDHAVTEDAIRASGMTWTFLRDCFYADLMELFIGEDGVLRGPAGDGRAAIVARADVARTAATVLVEVEKHRNVTYDLTGPEALTMREIVATIARVRGRDVRFVDETVEEAYASRAGYGAERWQLDAWVSTYTAIKVGQMGPVSNDIERVTGRAPMRFETLLRSTGR